MKLCSSVALVLIFSSSLVYAGDLEDNNISVVVRGDATVSTSTTGNLEVGVRGIGGEGNIGDSVIVNGVDIDCGVTTNCGNRNNVSIDVTGDATVTGTNAVVNGVRMRSQSIFQ